MASRSVPRLHLLFGTTSRPIRCLILPATSSTFTQSRPSSTINSIGGSGLLQQPRRPQARPSRSPPTPASRTARRTLFIQTETTPNPDALKFKPTSGGADASSAPPPPLLPPSLAAPFVEYLTPRATVAGPHHRSELAGRLLAVEGVTGVFVGRDFVTVSKDPGVAWALVKPEAFALIAEAVAGGRPVVEVVRPRGGDAAEGKGQEEAEGDSLAVAEGDGEVVAMIKELLDTRIRPAIREDGGDIEFRGFEDGIVSLKLRGACRTCDSSTVTLRNGIESMLMHYIEEVKGVDQVQDEEEEVAMREFQKFEERLRMQQGYVPLTTEGKGSLDKAE